MGWIQDVLTKQIAFSVDALTLGIYPKIKPFTSPSTKCKFCHTVLKQIVGWIQDVFTKQAAFSVDALTLGIYPKRKTFTSPSTMCKFFRTVSVQIVGWIQDVFTKHSAFSVDALTLGIDPKRKQFKLANMLNLYYILLKKLHISNFWIIIFMGILNVLHASFFKSIYST